jgi:serine/threonine protein kinase
MYRTSVWFFSAAITLFFSLLIHGAEQLPSLKTLASKPSFNPALEYKTHKTLGDGTFGTVYLISSRCLDEEKFYALKVYNRSTDCSSKEWEDNLAFLQTLPPHPNIVSIEWFSRNEPKKPVLIMEYLKGEEFFYVEDATIGLYRKSPNYELEKKILSRQIFEAVAFFETRGAANFDVKPENFVFRDPLSTQLVLVDFDLMSRHPNQDFHFCGSLEFLSPEMLWQENEPKEEGHEWWDQSKRDVWAAGLLLREIISGTYLCWVPEQEGIFIKDLGPRREAMRKSAIMSINSVPLPKTAVPMDANLKELVIHVLKKEPCKRWTAQKALESPWFHIPPYEEPVDGIALTLVSELGDDREIGDVFKGRERKIRVSPESTVSELMDAIMMKYEIRKSAFFLSKEVRISGEKDRKICLDLQDKLTRYKISHGTILYLFTHIVVKKE